MHTFSGAPLLVANLLDGEYALSYEMTYRTFASRHLKLGVRSACPHSPSLLYFSLK